MKGTKKLRTEQNTASEPKSEPMGLPGLLGTAEIKTVSQSMNTDYGTWVMNGTKLVMNGTKYIMYKTKSMFRAA